MKNATPQASAQISTLGGAIDKEQTMQSGRDLHLYNEIGEDTSQTSIDFPEPTGQQIKEGIIDALDVELQDLSSNRSNNV